jgi:PKD repeat protein
MMTKRLRATLGSIAAVVAFGLGCSTDSPTAPVQTPAPPPGTSPPSANWIIEVSVNPDILTVNDSQPATVTISVRRADNGNAPPTGTTIAISTSLGDFVSSGSGIDSTALETIGGRATVFLFAGSISGRALVSAQLETSVGQRTVDIMGETDPVEAGFSFQNSENNLSVTFLNTSTGDPTDFLWDFGDGTTSTEENPHHIFPWAGDFVVSLTASKEGSSDTASQIILVGEVIDLVADFEFLNSEINLSAQFLNTSSGDPTSFSWDFGDGSGSNEENPVHLFPAAGDYAVTLTVRRDGLTDEVSKFVTVGIPPPPDDDEGL